MLAATDDVNREALEGVLQRLGKQPGQMHFVYGSANENDYDGYWITALRIEGVPALDVLNVMQEFPFYRETDFVMPDDYRRMSIPVGGRVIYPRFTRHPDQSFAFYYPVGEVLFDVAGFGDMTVEDMLAALP